MNSAKEINTKNCTYYFFDDMINIENLDPDNIKIDEKSYKNIIYHIAHVTVKDLLLYKLRQERHAAVV